VPSYEIPVHLFFLLLLLLRDALCTCHVQSGVGSHQRGTRGQWRTSGRGSREEWWKPHVGRTSETSARVRLRWKEGKRERERERERERDRTIASLSYFITFTRSAGAVYTEPRSRLDRRSSSRTVSISAIRAHATNGSRIAQRDVRVIPIDPARVAEKQQERSQQRGEGLHRTGRKQRSGTIIACT